MVKRLFPGAADEPEPLSHYRIHDRVAPPDRPYVVVNMVESIDGSTAVDGVTKPLGSPTDRAIFLHLRDEADAVLVGASTVRAERYGPARTRPEARAARVRRGQRPSPPIAVVTRSVQFDWDTPLFHHADPAPILLLPADTDAGTLRRAERFARLFPHGHGAVDLVQGFAQLRESGVNVLLCEGGPSLNSELLGLGLVDELCLTIAPMLSTGRNARGIFGSALTERAAGLALRHALEEDGFLYLRYQVRSTSP